MPEIPVWKKRLRLLFAIVDWLPRYDRRDLRGDTVAGLTVGVMLIPQGMAYAVLAGVPPIYGLYASLVPLLLYPLFGTSRHLALGVIAIDMLIVAAGLGGLAEIGEGEYIALAILLAMLVGVMQMAMGLARLGFLVNLLSRPVISGFTSAAALIICFSQLENLLGVPLPRTQYVHVILWELVQQVGETHLLTLGVGLGAVLLIVGLRKWKPIFPAGIVAVALGLLAGWGLTLEGEGVAVVGAIPTGLPTPSLPAFDAPTLRALLPTAATLVLVQFMTVISLGKLFAAKHRYSISANRELFALGAANFFGGIFRSIPVSGSFSRTAVNDQAGARTPLANVVAAGLVALTLLFLTPIFYYLPIPILGAIILVAAFGLLDVQEMRYLLRTKRIDGYLALLTFLATLIIGIQEGILIGVAASVTAIMYRISRPNVAVLGHLPGTRSFRDTHRVKEAVPIENILILRIDASFSFANAELLKDLILKQSQEDGADVRAVIIDASSVNDLDTTAVAVLTAVEETLAERGVELYFGGMRGTARGVMVRSGLVEKLGEDHFFLSPHRAVVHVLKKWGRSADYLEDVPAQAEPVEPGR